MTTRRKFRKHQRQAFRYASGTSIALLMEMRLGKTLVAIRWAKKKARGSVLVVTPATTIHVWQDELRQEGIEPCCLEGSSLSKAKAFAKGALDGWYVINPEGVRACPELCNAADWDVVILDESGGWFTNPQAKVVKVIRKKLQQVRCRAILTGLPDPNGPEDFVEQMIFAFGQFMGCRSYWHWRVKYMQPGFFKWELQPNSRRKIKAAVRELAFQKTAKQAGCFVPKVYERRYLEHPPQLRKLTRELKKDFSLGEVETKWAVVVGSWLAMLAGGVAPEKYDPENQIANPFKAAEVVRLLQTELKRQRVVVWARFIREIKLVQRELQRAGVKCQRLTGFTKQKHRPRILRNFRRGVFDVLIIEGSVGQYALDISHADAMIFYSNCYNGSIRGQCEKRCDHMDKKKPVLIVDLVTQGTIDECILDVLRSKKVSSKDFAQRVFVKARKAGLI